MPKRITAHKCDYCTKISRSPSAILKHEPLCRKNPENIPACFGCCGLTELKTPEVYEEHKKDVFGDTKTLISGGIPCARCEADVVEGNLYWPITGKKHAKYLKDGRAEDVWVDFFKTAQTMPMECSEWQERERYEEDYR